MHNQIYMLLHWIHVYKWHLPITDGATDTVKFLYQDHFWDCPKVVFKTTFGQSQRWCLIRGTLGVENEKKNNLNFANKVFNGQDVLILGGLNSRISLYFPHFPSRCKIISFFNSSPYLECQNFLTKPQYFFCCLGVYSLYLEKKISQFSLSHFLKQIFSHTKIEMFYSKYYSSSDPYMSDIFLYTPFWSHLLKRGAI